MNKLLPLILLASAFAKVSAQAVVPFTTCPDVSIAVVRAGTNADITNPYFIYTVNTATGAMTLLPGGPLINTNPDFNIQVNGVGLNKTDGFLYGLSFDGTFNTARLIRFDKNYGLYSTPNLAPPSSFTGINGYINAGTGDCDRSDNYYYSAFTANPGATPGTLVLDKLYIGKIPNVSVLSPGTPTAEYYEIDMSDLPCTDFVNSITNDPANNGFKDFVFSPFTNTFYTYLSYKLPGDINYSGKLAEIRPIAGSNPLKYKLFCNSIVNTNSADVQGTLIDKNGNFEVLFTDGSMWKMSTTGTIYNYNGNITLLNPTPGLPNRIVGDLASCGGPVSGPLPVRLTSFDVNQNNCTNKFMWTVQNETNFSHYEIEESFDGFNFSYIAKIAANNNGNGNYNFTTASAGKQAYYRLKALDKDGNYMYSQVLNVLNSCDANSTSLIINPNPAKDAINLNWYGVKQSGEMSITIFNGVGKAMQKVSRSVASGNSRVTLNISQLSPGLYFIKAVDAKTSDTYQVKFIKQ